MIPRPPKSDHKERGHFGRTRVQDNDRNTAFLCRNAGPRRRRGGTRRVVGNAAGRAPDRLGVLQRPLHARRSGSSARSAGTSTADGASAPHQHLSPGRDRQLHVRDGERLTAARDRPATCCCCRSQPSTSSGTATPPEFAFAPGPRPAGPDRRHVDVQLRRRRRRDAARLRLSRIVGVSVHAGVPHASGHAGRADRRRQGRRTDRLDGARGASRWSTRRRRARR